MSLEKYNYIGPKLEKEQKESVYIDKVKKYSDIVLKGPTLDNYDNYVEAIDTLLDIDKEEFDNSLMVGGKMDEVLALERFIKAIENEKNPFEHRDGVPNFFKY